MPEFTPMEIAVLAGMLVLGIIVGWMFRAGRCAKEKININASWQEQLESQRSEHERLANQNQSLMQQISQYQASMKDSNMRAKELSDSLKEAFQRRDQLQQQMKEIRGNMEVAVAQREKLKEEVASRQSRDELSIAAIRDRDNKIFRLSRELISWQNRVPPLVEKFRERDLEAQDLEVELNKARDRIAALESTVGRDVTRIEPVDPDSLANGLDASNDPLDDLSGEFESELVDQNSAYNEQLAHANDTSQPELRDYEGTLQAEALATDSPLAADDADDLKLIKGVGPAIEKTLNDLGIYRFNQIAEMSEYDIDRVAQRLKGFRSRIYREDWVGQARTLQYQKNNEIT